MITLDIFSDPVCPWCMIGKAHLDRALAEIGEHTFQIAWHPFQLNPDMPRGGQDRRDFLEAKFGSQLEAAKAYIPVQQAAEAAGLEINFERMTHQPNTLNAHRLIHWAGLESPATQTEVVDLLFKAFFRDGRDLDDPLTLIDIASKAGMDPDAVRLLLQGEADADDLLARDQDARQKGVKAVPTFLVARRYVVEGAQPPELWLKVAEELKELAQAQN